MDKRHPAFAVAELNVDTEVLPDEHQYNKRTIVTLIHVFFKPSRVFYISRKYIYNCTVNRLGPSITV